MADQVYSNIDRAYDNQLMRSGFNIALNDVPGVTQEEASRTIKAGSALNDAWIDTWIKSSNYSPKKKGFMLDAKRGLIEGEWLQVGTGMEVYGNDAYFYDYSTGGKGIAVGGATIAVGGTGYVVGNVLTVVQDGGADGRIRVDSVTPVTGVITAITVINSGAGYALAAGLATTGGSGTGATITINTLTTAGDYAGDTTTLHFQRKFFPDQEFIFEKRIGIDSSANNNADNVFNMYYPNKEQTIDSITYKRNYIFVGTAGNTTDVNEEYTDVIRAYSNQGFQYSTGKYYKLNTEFGIYTSNYPGVTMNPGGSNINFSYGETNPKSFLNPANIKATSIGGRFSVSAYDPTIPGTDKLNLLLYLDQGSLWAGNHFSPLEDKKLNLGTIDWPTGSGTPYRWNNIYCDNLETDKINSSGNSLTIKGVTLTPLMVTTVDDLGFPTTRWFLTTAPI